MILSKPQRMGNVCDRFAGISLMVPHDKATDDDRDNYCLDPEKLGSGFFFQVGKRTSQGQRTDIEAATEMLTEGASMRDVAEAAPVTYVRYHRGLHAYRDVIRPDRNIAEFHLWIISGTPGSGKTTGARRSFPEAYWVPRGRSLWFPHYEDQRTLVFDEFDGAFVPFDVLTTICSTGPADLEAKGTSARCMADTAILLTNRTLGQLYDWTVHNMYVHMHKHTHTHRDAFLRRVCGFFYVRDRASCAAAFDAIVRGCGRRDHGVPLVAEHDGSMRPVEPPTRIEPVDDEPLEYFFGSEDEL